MTCAIVYSSRTGNTKQLAEAVRASLGEQTCLYMGPPDDRALQHPDAEDLSHLTSAVTAGCKPV